MLDRGEHVVDQTSAAETLDSFLEADSIRKRGGFVAQPKIENLVGNLNERRNINIFVVFKTKSFKTNNDSEALPPLNINKSVQ